MRLIKTILLVVLMAGLPAVAMRAQTTATPPASGGPVLTQATPEDLARAGQETEKAGHGEGLTAHAPEIFRVGSFPVTNSMVVTWIVAVVVIVFAQYATRRMKEVPDGAQNFWEWVVESLYEFLEGIIGHDLVKKTFWFFASIFIFILFCNWAGLLPGLGTFGWGEQTPQGLKITHPFFRGANADLNMTLAMALVFFACWIWWALQVNGPMGFLRHLFAPKGETTGALKLLMIVVFLVVGCLEVFSILFRPVSLSFRLYGNIFAGENMLESMSRLIQHPAWAKAVFSFILPIPFYFMELLVGFVQALVFMLLTAVFTMLICQHEEGREAAQH